MDRHTNHQMFPSSPTKQGFHHQGDGKNIIPPSSFANHPYYQPRIPMNRAKSHEDVCLQRMVGLREQHSKSTQQLMTQLNLAKELVKERVVIKDSARRREPSENVQNYSSSADEVQQMRRQNRMGKTSLAAMKYLSSVDHRRSSSLLGVNTIIHKKKPVNCTENVQYCQNVDEEIHEVSREDENESSQPSQKTIVVNINEKLASSHKRSSNNLIQHQHSSSELRKV